jgi:dCMP deaminase
VADAKMLDSLDRSHEAVVMPDEDVSRAVAGKYLQGSSVEFDRFFLRWDKQSTTGQHSIVPDCEVTEDAFDLEIMDMLDQEKEKSADFWRQVAGAVVKDGRIVAHVHNKHVPDFELPYIYGDPRFNFSKGIEVDLGTVAHVERALISTCARNGIPTEGASIYVTTFPCPACAKAVALAGFARCYFREGYSMLDAESVLKAYGVRLIQVK